jgi:hypothetical protein
LPSGIFEWVNDGCHPATRIVVASAVRYCVVRVVLDGWHVCRFSGKPAANEVKHALGLKLRILENVVIGDLFQTDAPQLFPGSIDTDRPTVG